MQSPLIKFITLINRLIKNIIKQKRIVGRHYKDLNHIKYFFIMIYFGKKKWGRFDLLP